MILEQFSPIGNKKDNKSIYFFTIARGGCTLRGKPYKTLWKLCFLNSSVAINVDTNIPGVPRIHGLRSLRSLRSLAINSE